MDFTEHFAVLLYDRDGTSLEIEERPIWAKGLEMLGNELLEHTGHFLCCNIPDWLFEIGWGTDESSYDIDDPSYFSYRNNLGHYILTLGNWVAGGFGTWKYRKRIAKIPVTSEWLAEHYPDAGWSFDGEEDDAMRCTPEDAGDKHL